jgi:hypothetical protein
MAVGLEVAVEDIILLLDKEVDQVEFNLEQ